MVKIIKLGLIIYPKDYNLLYDLRCEYRSAANRAVQYFWEIGNNLKKYCTENGEYPSKEKMKELYGYTTQGGVVYSRLKDEFVTLNTSVLTSAQTKAEKRLKQDAKDITRGTRSIPSFRDIPITVPSKNIKLELCQGENYTISLSLLSRKGIKDWGEARINMRIKSPRSSYTKRILKQIGEDNSVITASQLKYDKNSKKYYMLLGYNTGENTEKALSEQQCLVSFDEKGIVCSANDIRAVIDAEYAAITLKKAKMRDTRIRQQKRGAYCGKGNEGRGRQKHLTEIKNNKVSNIVNTQNYKFAKQIIDFAVNSNCGTIKISLPSSPSESALGEWAYGDLITKIKNKARDNNMKII